MRKNIKTLLIVLFLGLCLPRAALALEDTIVAVVNDDVITLHDLRDYVDSIVTQKKLEGAAPEELKQLVNDMAQNGLDRLIADKILLAAANKKDIKVDDELVDRRVDGVKGQYRTEDDFLKALVDEGVSVTDIRNKIKNQIKIKRLIDDEIRAKIYVNPQEVTDYYKNHFEEFQKPERVNLDSIFIAKDKDNPDAARQKAEEAFAKLKEGKDFKDVAKDYSQAPSVGMIKKGQTLPEIEKAVFGLEPGQVSGVCEVENGFYIFKLLGHSKKDLASLDEAKSDIHTRIFNEKFQAKFQAWLEKLKKEAFIDVKKHL